MDAVSAGFEETPLDPDAVAAMSEVGIDISGHEPDDVEVHQLGLWIQVIRPENR